MDEIYREIEDGIENRKKFAETLKNSKYNLDELLSGFMKISMDFYYKGVSPAEKIKFPTINFETTIEGNQISIPIEQNVYTDLITLVNIMHPSLLAPFYHYNNYIDYFCNDFLRDDIKFEHEESKHDSSALSRAKYQIEIQALLISIKAGLDRFIGIFSYYYKGISPHTTFGRLKDNDKLKFEGFMFTVDLNKDTDTLLEFIYNEYFDWIKIAVAPRDTITHYNDLSIYYEYNSSIEGDIPHHFNERLIKDKGQKVSPVYVYSYLTIKEFAESWSRFIRYTFSALLEKELITYKPKF